MNKAFEKILKRLEEVKNFEYLNGVKRFSKKERIAFDNAKEIVHEVEEEYNGGWIACSSDNMPNNGQKVYVEFNDGKHMCLVYRTKDSRDKSNGWEMNITQDGFYEICSDYGYMPYRNIIVWQPLPEPCKERDSE